MYWPTGAERIARYNPAMRFVMLLRNPITRAFSHWNYSRLVKREQLPFLEALHAEEERQLNRSPYRAKRFSYVERGFYTRQLQRLWRYFPANQTLIFKTEELLEDPNGVLDRIASFLDIAPFAPVAGRTVNAREYNAVMSDEERRYLAGVYEQEIHDLERLLGWDCSEWLT
jgi:hypothetical protein